MSSDLEPRHEPVKPSRRREHWEGSAEQLVERYAGFAMAEGLTDAEKLLAVVSLVPMALEIIEEARDTIERLNRENEELLEQLWDGADGDE